MYNYILQWLIKTNLVQLRRNLLGKQNNLFLIWENLQILVDTD